MIPGDLTIDCDPTVTVGHDLEVRAERHTVPVAEVWDLCVATNRCQIQLKYVWPAAVRCGLDDDGVLRLSFPSDVCRVCLALDAGEIGESEWQFWVDDSGQPSSPHGSAA